MAKDYTDLEDGFIELIQEFYEEIYGDSILLIQSGYSEGIIVIDGLFWDSWSNEERDSFC